MAADDEEYFQGFSVDDDSMDSEMRLVKHYLRELRRKLIKCAAKKQGELASKGFPARSRLGFRLVGVQTSK